MINRHCPICDNVTVTSIKTIEFDLFDGHPMNGGYDLVQCSRCGFIYANTPVTQQQLDTYYTELSKYESKVVSTGGGYSQEDKKRLEETGLFIGQYLIDKNASILDLGCANGGLLNQLKSMGYTNLMGIDPSIACVETTTNEVGCVAHQYSLFKIPESIGKFDLIILSHVMEHILDVSGAMEVIKTMLNDNGLLYIECPNAACYKNIIHTPLQEFNTEHINHFTKTSFRNLADIHGFSEVSVAEKTFEIASGQDYYCVYGLFRTGSNIKNKVVFDSHVLDDIQQYIKESDSIMQKIESQLESIPESMSIALFGVGQFAFKILKFPVFNNSHREYFLFDNNAINVGKVIRKMTIQPGSSIVGQYQKNKMCIVISSLIYEKQIRKGIEAKFENNGKELPYIIGFSHLIDQ